MKFKSKPEALRALPDPDEVARFAAGADTRTVEPGAPAPTRAVEPSAPAPAMSVVRSPPWETLDKAAKPLSGINLRLNEYEHELLKFLAEQDQRSIQQTIKRLLIPAAESAAEAIRK